MIERAKQILAAEAKRRGDDLAAGYYLGKCKDDNFEVMAVAKGLILGSVRDPDELEKRVWGELKTECNAPTNARRCVMVGEDQLRAAVRRALQ